MKLVEVLDDAAPLGQLGQRERCQDVQMARVRIFDSDVLDQRDLAQHILVVVALVDASVDDGDGKPPADLEQHHHRHGEDAIDLAGDTSELAACVVAIRQFDGDEDVGLEQGDLDGFILEQRGAAGKLFVCKLEQQFSRLPACDQCCRVFQLGF